MGCCSLATSGMVEFFTIEEELLDDFEKELKDFGYFKDA
jgi:hypothetical protein